ncbi:MAG: TlpA family protein disulfide reductase [Prevotella sp.]|nr:TlpA family protein disulfide reductase [Prevotella sp.]
MTRRLTTAILLLAALTVQAQQKAFVIQGTMPLPDGYNVGLCCHTDTAYAAMVAESWMKDGRFVLQGSIDKPYQGTLMTNNLQMVEQNHWPTDSIHWTYTEVFVTPDTLQFSVSSFHDDKTETLYALTGTQTQADYNDWLRSGAADPWAFIDGHPASVVTTWLACQLTDRAYNLTAEQTARLEQTVKGSPADPQRFALYQQKLTAAKKTVKNAPLTDLELTDTKGTVCRLVDVVPRNGKYTLIDFWASWCGICLHAMPDISAMAAQYKDVFGVIAVSIDTKADAWHRAMEKNPEPWPQYCTTAAGYKDLFTKYQVGNGVPYYLLLSPDGRVIGSPSGPEEIREFLENLNQ